MGCKFSIGCGERCYCSAVRCNYRCWLCNHVDSVLHGVSMTFFNHHISTVKVRLLCGFISQAKLSMIRSKINLELSPSFVRNCSCLSCATCIREQSSVKYKCRRNFYDHRISIYVSTGHRKSSCTLNMLEDILYRLIRIIRRVKILVW
jgi:hypothetical protein